MWGIGFALAALITADVGTAAAQISGRVIFREGPIGVDVVFGRRPSVVIDVNRGPRGRVVADRRPARYAPGMSLLELRRYRAWIEAEYRTFRRMDEEEAWYRLGWTERQLEDYVDWLKDERRFLKREDKRLRRAMRAYGEYAPAYDDWSDRSHWDDDEWDDDWSDRYDWDDDDRDDDDWDDDDWDDDDRDEDRRRRGRRGR